MGILGMGINMAMVIFSNGTPAFLQYLGMQEAPAVFLHLDCVGLK